MQPNGKRGNVTHYINTFMTAAHCASRLGFTAAVVDLTGAGYCQNLLAKAFENALFEEESTPVEKRVSRKRRNF